MTEIPGMPDLPILRHLTWREAHLFELGIYPGLGLGIAFLAHEWGAALALVALVRRRMQADDQHRNTDDLIRGYMRDAWYFGAGGLAGFIFILLANALV